MTAPAPVGDLARIARSFAGLAAGEAIARGMAFIGTLVIARRLGPSMYGIVGVASGILLYCNQVADAGVELSGVPLIARDRARAGDVASATLSFRMLLAIALSVVVVAISVLALPEPDGAVLAIYALSLPAVAASARWILIGWQRPDAVAVARVAGESLALVILVFAVRDAGDVPVVPFAFVTGAALTAIVMLGGTRRIGLRLDWRPDWALARPLFEKAPHLVGFTLLGLLLFNFDLIYLRVVSGAAQAGYYAAAYTFVAFASNLSVAWAQSVMPALARLQDRPVQRDAVYATTQALGIAVTLPVALGGMVVARPLVELVFGPGYVPAAGALAWLLPAVPLAVLREVAVAVLIGTPAGERRLFQVNARSVVLNVALVVPVVPVFGLVGAAAATVATEVARLWLSMRHVHRAGVIGAAPVRFVKPAAAGVVMAGAVFLATPASLAVLVPLGAATYALALWGLGGVVVERGRWPRLSV